jgi:importin subunit beta-1
MMCLAEIIRLYYNYIDSNINEITDLTFKIMKEDCEEVGTLAIEVWCSICEEEIELKKNGEECKNYAQTIFKELLALMLNLLNDEHIDEDDENSNWNRSTAAGCCLHLMAQNVGDAIIKDVINFVEGKIGEEATWQDKYFGLLALGAILQGPSKESLLNVLAPAMGVILSLFEDPSRKVRETTAWFFSKVAQNHAELLATEEFFPTFYKYILNGLKDEVKVACNSASIVTELAKSLKPVYGQNRNILSSYYPELIESIVECSYRKDEIKHYDGRSENKITVAGFDALYSLFENAPPDTEPLLLKSLEHFYNKLRETNSTENQPLDERTTDLQSFLCVCIQTILNRLDEGLSNEVCEGLIDAIKECFDTREEVFEEGFLLLSALCSKFGPLMDNYVDKIGPYIFHGLKEEGGSSSDTIKNA